MLESRAVSPWIQRSKYLPGAAYHPWNKNNDEYDSEDARWGKSKEVLEAHLELEERGIKRAMKYTAWAVAEEHHTVPGARGSAGTAFLADMNLPKTAKTLREQGFDIPGCQKFYLSRRKSWKSWTSPVKKGESSSPRTQIRFRDSHSPFQASERIHH